MAKQYLVIDLETPNRRNDRISAIAVTSIVDDKIQGNRYYLVNPEAEFDDFNVKLTGISPMDVVSAPTFPEVWEQIRDDFAACTIVAHNAPFDLCVLEKTCQAYSIPFDPPTYIDTVRLAKVALPELVQHRLNDVCEALSLELEHHQADSDCAACAEIFLHCMRSGLEPVLFERVFREESSGSVRRMSIRELIDREQRRKETAAFLAVHAYDGPVSIGGALVAVTGDFANCSRLELTALLGQKGAIVKKSVIKKLDYLFVGSLGSEQWASGFYGSKIKKALELQDAGASVKIVQEDVLFRILESAPDAEAPSSAPTGRKEVEREIYQELLPVLTSIEERNFLPEGGISLESGSSYSSVFVHGSLVCRICWRKSRYIAIKGTPEQYPAVTAFQYEQKTYNGSFINIMQYDRSDVQTIFPLLEQVAQDVVDQIPKDYDCCSRFDQCCKARACIHPDKEFAKACGYRKKLAHGIVFGVD